MTVLYDESDILLHKQCTGKGAIATARAREVAGQRSACVVPLAQSLRSLCSLSWMQ